MDDLLIKNSLLTMGNWLILSLLSGLVVGASLLIYRALFPDSSAKIRYQTALISLATLLFFTLFLASVMPNISILFSGAPQEAITNNYFLYPELINQLAVDNSAEAVLVQGTIGKSSYIAITQIGLGIFWLVGIVIYTIKFLGGFIYLKLLLQHASSVIPQYWLEKTLELKNQLKIGSKVNLLVSKKVNSPLTFGFLKPVIIFPIGFFTTLPTDQIEAIILHELYHIKHKDYLLNMLVMIIEILFFYHPLVWFLSKEIQAERENTCDDAVIDQIQNPLNYAKALISVEEFRHRRAHLSLHFSSKSSQLNHRVMRLFSERSSKTYSLKPFIGFIFLTFFLMSFTLLSWDITESSEVLSLEYSGASEKNAVKVKIAQKDDEFILVVAENAISTKLKKGKYAVWLDDVQLKLNSSHAIKYVELAGMVGTKKGDEYRIYSKGYLSGKGVKELIPKNNHDVIYHFHTNGGTHYTSEFDIWTDKSKMERSKNAEADEKSSKSASANQYTVYGPLKFITKESMELGKADELSGLRLNRINSRVPDPSIITAESAGLILRSIVPQDTTKLSRNNSNDAKIQTDSVLVVLNGEILGVGFSQLSVLDPDKISSLNVLKGDKALEKYGQKAVSGVLEIMTKDNFNEEDRKLLINSFSKIDLTEVKIESLSEENQPIYYVDGLPMEQSYLKNIDPNNIKEVVVLKDEKAIKKYGKKAEHGVVEIYLKEKIEE